MPALHFYASSHTFTHGGGLPALPRLICAARGGAKSWRRRGAGEPGVCCVRPGRRSCPGSLRDCQDALLNALSAQGRPAKQLLPRQHARLVLQRAFPAQLGGPQGPAVRSSTVSATLYKENTSYAHQSGQSALRV